MSRRRSDVTRAFDDADRFLHLVLGGRCEHVGLGIGQVAALSHDPGVDGTVGLRAVCRLQDTADLLVQVSELPTSVSSASPVHARTVPTSRDTARGPLGQIVDGDKRWPKDLRVSPPSGCEPFFGAGLALMRHEYPFPRANRLGLIKRNVSTSK